MVAVRWKRAGVLFCVPSLSCRGIDGSSSLLMGTVYSREDIREPSPPVFIDATEFLVPPEPVRNLGVQTPGERSIFLPVRYWSMEERTYRAVYLLATATDTARDIANAAARLSRGNFLPQHVMLFLNDDGLPPEKPVLSFLNNIKNGGVLEIDDMCKKK